MRPTGKVDETAVKAAENTLAAFEEALQQGADGIELDVRLSRDGIVVVAHDVDLARVTNGQDPRTTNSLTAAELAKIPLAREGFVPTLDETLSWAAVRRTVVNVEIKRDVPNRVALVRAVAASLTRSNAHVVVSSFDPLLLALLAPLRPNVPRALLLHAGQGRRGAAAALALPRSFVQALHFEGAMITPLVARLAAVRQVTLGSWTINDPEEGKRLAALGVAALISDAPGAIRRTLTS